MKTKSLKNITEQELLECLKSDIPEGWEVFSFKIDKYLQFIKIRKPYDEGEFNFNEDGFKYQTVFLRTGTTRHYKYLVSKGYNTEN